MAAAFRSFAAQFKLCLEEHHQEQNEKMENIFLPFLGSVNRLEKDMNSLRESINSVRDEELRPLQKMNK